MRPVPLEAIRHIYFILLLKTALLVNQDFVKMLRFICWQSGKNLGHACLLPSSSLKFP